MKRLFILLMISFSLLGGCSSKLAYNNIDWLLYWYLDDYIELEKEQKGLLDSKLEAWLVWHRSSELDVYQRHLQALQQQLSSNTLDAERWLEHFELARGHWFRARDKISPELINMAVAVNDGQIISLFETLEKENAKREKKRAKNSPEERQEERRENIEGQVKDWIGRLSSEQKALVAIHSAQLGSTFEDWMAYRRSIQNKAKTLLLQRNENLHFQQELLYLVQHPEEYQQQSYIDKSQTNRVIFADMLEQISESLSAKQRKKSIKKLQGLIEDLDDLVED